MTRCEIGEQIRVRRLPAEELARARVRRQVVELRGQAEEAAQELAGFFGWDALRRYAESASDRLGDRAERNFVVGRCVETSARRGRLERKTIAAFDDVARLAADLCATEIALITLVEPDYQWLKARELRDGITLVSPSAH